MSQLVGIPLASFVPSPAHCSLKRTVSAPSLCNDFVSQTPSTPALSHSCPILCRDSRVSDSGGTAVYSPQEPGGSRAHKAERAAGVAHSAWGGKERPISHVLQAGQDEIGAGAGAVAMSITPEELGQACLIGQVRRGIRGG